jgi:hypothetical protein
MGSHLISSVVHHVALSIISSKDKVGRHLEVGVLVQTQMCMVGLCSVQSHYVMEMITPPNVGVLSLIDLHCHA